MQDKKADFLVEIQTEELPPKSLKKLGMSFLFEITKQMKKENLTFGEARFFATPRRLAVLIKKLSSKQPDGVLERRGPALNVAFDEHGKASSACEGFARSCGVNVAELTTIKTPQGEWVGFRQKTIGKSTKELLPSIINYAVSQLPIPKKMRWGSSSIEFVRPVHSVIVLFGNEVIDATILGVVAGRETKGHRFLCKKTISIAKPSLYEKKLLQGFVIADFSQRQNEIREQIISLVAKEFADQASLIIDENLLEEVTGLVEWPVSLLGHFDKQFLSAPREALISAMQDHQRYFPLVNDKNELLPNFITVSNIESQMQQQVVAGNERVIRARLADANFFFTIDKKQSLFSRVKKLNDIIFQAKLGTLQNKANRIAAMAKHIAEKMMLDVGLSERAGLLAKADLTTTLVGEFPELQGVAGYYYALHDGEDKRIAIAIKEHYLPAFSGGQLPASELGNIVALADKIDTLVGIFGINLAPTGDKDPYALRRAAMGVIRILVENKINLDLAELLNFSVNTFDHVENKNVINDVKQFTFERLKPWYQEQEITTDVFAAVAALNVTHLLDFHQRLLAVQEFKKMPEAIVLSAANKRVSNILENVSDLDLSRHIDSSLLQLAEEKELVNVLQTQSSSITELCNKAEYQAALTQLSKLKSSVDNFFDKVLVMDEDKQLRNNRLLILAKLRNLFLQVADVALLQHKD